MRVLLLSVAVVLPTGGLLAAGDGAVEAPRNRYHFRVERVGRGELTFQGGLVVDGKPRTFDAESTPFDFECEAANDLFGRITPRDKSRKIRLRAYVRKAHGEKRVASIKGYKIEFRWTSGMAGRQRISFAAVQ